MKFKFGDKVQIVKGKFHKGAIGTVVGFFSEESTQVKVNRRYLVALDYDVQVHASHSWLEKVNLKNEILK